MEERYETFPHARFEVLLEDGGSGETAPASVVDDRHAALEVVLLLADADARWGDYGGALRLLDIAEATTGELLREYQVKRSRWSELHAKCPPRPLLEGLLWR